MSALSVDNSGIYRKINTQDRLIKNSSVSANVSLSVCPKTPFFKFQINKKNILKSPQQRTDKADIGGFPTNPMCIKKYTRLHILLAVCK